MGAFDESDITGLLQEVAIRVNTARTDGVATLRSVDKERTLRIQQGARLQAARKAAGYRSAREAAASNSWAESTYRAHEGGSRTIGQDDAERYARRFRAAGANITGRQILFGDEPPAHAGLNGTAPSGRFVMRVVPLLSWVSAGELADPDSQIPTDEVPLLAYAELGRGDFFALDVKGDSMNRISPEGSRIVVNRAERTLVADAPYVFAVRGEATYKLWQPSPPHLEPFSTNPVHKPIFVRGRADMEVIGRVRRTTLDL
jgi:SOS-response transcriptional repressor LexA